MVAADPKRQIEADALYDQFGKPFEDEHKGEFIALSKDGKTLLGPTALDVMQKARAAFGPGSFIFKVGDRSAGKWR
jgi:hypothetical protein